MNQQNIIFIILIFGIILITIFQVVKNKENFSPGNPDDVALINKNFKINQNPNLLSLHDFTDFAEKGEKGDLGLMQLRQEGKLWLGGPNYGNAGENINNEVQLYLGGKHKMGANNGRPSHTTYKLKIDSYDNDNSVVYPIYCEDENKNVDFYIKNRSGNLPTEAYFGGDLNIKNQLHCKSLLTDYLMVNGELNIHSGKNNKNDWLISTKLEKDALVIINPKNKNNPKKGYIFHDSDGLLVPENMEVKKKIVANKIKTKHFNVDGNFKVKKITIGGVDMKEHFIPRGIIIAFGKSIKEIPKGWALCDGKNGTPDLRNRFIIGQGTKYPYNSKGGSETIKLTIDNLPKHKHTINIGGGHKHKYKDIYWADKNGVVPIGADHGRTIDMGENDNTNPISKGYEKIRYTDKSTSEHTHEMSEVGNSKPHTNMPPFFSLYYIMKL